MTAVRHSPGCSSAIVQGLLGQVSAGTSQRRPAKRGTGHRVASDGMLLISDLFHEGPVFPLGCSYKSGQDGWSSSGSWSRQIDVLFFHICQPGLQHSPKSRTVCWVESSERSRSAWSEGQEGLSSRTCGAHHHPSPRLATEGCPHSADTNSAALVLKTELKLSRSP